MDAGAKARRRGDAPMLPEHEGVADAVFRAAQAEFPGTLVVELCYAIAEINAWNRLMIASRTPPRV